MQSHNKFGVSRTCQKRAISILVENYNEWYPSKKTGEDGSEYPEFFALEISIPIHPQANLRTNPGLFWCFRAPYLESRLVVEILWAFFVILPTEQCNFGKLFQANAHGLKNLKIEVGGLSKISNRVSLISKNVSKVVLVVILWVPEGGVNFFLKFLGCQKIIFTHVGQFFGKYENYYTNHRKMA